MLPEDRQLEGVARALGVSSQNEFGLLEALGGDVAGALALWPAGQAPPTPGEGQVRALDESDLARLIDGLPRRPLMAGEPGVRLSLAGAQAKVPVVRSAGQVALPAPGQPTTHILKPPIPVYPDSTANEVFAMRLAAAVGLSAAPVEVRRAEGRAFLLVRRYDRLMDGARTRRLHQEDFCQALGIPSEHKYAAEGGPTFKVAFDLVRRVCARPAIAALALLDAAIFNVVIGNADAHGKNFSLLFGPKGVELAPLYDLMVTAAYTEVSPNLAMRIAGRARIEDFDAETWPAFAADIGVPAPYVLRRVQAMAAAILGRVDEVARGLADEGVEAGAFAELVTTRAEVVTRTAGRS